MNKIVISTTAVCFIASAQAAPAAQPYAGTSIFSNIPAMCEIFKSAPSDFQATLPDEITITCALGSPIPQDLSTPLQNEDQQSQKSQNLSIDDRVALKALPKIIEHVEKEMKKSCDQVAHMEKEEFKVHLTIPRIAKNYQDFKVLCERRKGILDNLKSGNEEIQLDILRKISADPNVKNIIIADIEVMNDRHLMPHVSPNW